jgi:hypothetical protein
MEWDARRPGWRSSLSGDKESVPKIVLSTPPVNISADRLPPGALHASSQGQRPQRDICACWLRAAFYSNPRFDKTRALVFTRGDVCRSESAGGAARAGNGKAVLHGDFATRTATEKQPTWLALSVGTLTRARQR